MAACRREIAPDIIQFLNDAYRYDEMVTCALSGFPVLRDKCHVHHRGKRMSVLVDEFISEFRVNLDTVEYTDGDMVSESFFVDRELANAWIAFHRERADLVITDSFAHVEASK